MIDEIHVNHQEAVQEENKRMADILYSLHHPAYIKYEKQADSYKRPSCISRNRSNTSDVPHISQTILMNEPIPEEILNQPPQPIALMHSCSFQPVEDIYFEPVDWEKPRQQLSSNPLPRLVVFKPNQDVIQSQSQVETQATQEQQATQATQEPDKKITQTIIIEQEPQPIIKFEGKPKHIRDIWDEQEREKTLTQDLEQEREKTLTQDLEQEREKTLTQALEEERENEEKNLTLSEAEKTPLSPPVLKRQYAYVKEEEREEEQEQEQTQFQNILIDDLTQSIELERKKSQLQNEQNNILLEKLAFEHEERFKQLEEERKQLEEEKQRLEEANAALKKISLNTKKISALKKKTLKQTKEQKEQAKEQKLINLTNGRPASTNSKKK